MEIVFVFRGGETVTQAGRHTTPNTMGTANRKSDPRKKKEGRAAAMSFTFERDLAGFGLARLGIFEILNESA